MLKYNGREFDGFQTAVLKNLLEYEKSNELSAEKRRLMYVFIFLKLSSPSGLPVLQ
jgi:hypothetical protein